jgi:hypothetical protein
MATPSILSALKRQARRGGGIPKGKHPKVLFFEQNCPFFKDAVELVAYVCAFVWFCQAYTCGKVDGLVGFYVLWMGWVAGRCVLFVCAANEALRALDRAVASGETGVGKWFAKRI